MNNVLRCLVLALVSLAHASPSDAQQAAGPAPARVEAAPAAGFHHPYLVVVPAKVKPGAPFVVVLPTPPTATNPADLLAAAERMAANASPFLAQLEAPILVPVLPRPPVRTPEGTINLYVPALSREALLAREPALARMDRQVLAMLDDARRRLATERQVETHERAVMVGFSAGGHFATRMAALHPERVLAVWAGGTGMHPILPAAEIDGRQLTYPVGIADLDEVSGRRFDAKAFSKIPMLIVQGSADTNTSLPSGVGPSDSYSKEQARLAFELLGKTAGERLEKVRKAYAGAGSRAEFRVYPGVEHRISPEMARDIVRFIRERVVQGH